jgi:hypothetical protein
MPYLLLKQALLCFICAHSLSLHLNIHLVCIFFVLASLRTLVIFLFMHWVLTLWLSCCAFSLLITILHIMFVTYVWVHKLSTMPPLAFPKDFKHIIFLDHVPFNLLLYVVLIEGKTFKSMLIMLFLILPM